MKRILFFSVLLLVVISTKSQVTIGSETAPAKGALLDLKMEGNMSTKGLGMPRVTLRAIKGDLGRTLGATEDSTLLHREHIGLIVYNVGKNEVAGEERFCPGLHVWDGKVWNPLKPYTEIEEIRRKLVSVKNRSFTYLDPNNPDDRWPAGKQNTDYPLGHIGTFTDNRKNETRVNTYNYARLYVGYKTREVTYEVTLNYSCDPNIEVPYTYTETSLEETFDDGIWMTQNLNTIVNNDGVTLTRHNGNSNTVSQYYYPGNTNRDNPSYGVLYNWRAALGVGTSTGSSAFPENKEGGGANGFEHNPIQGICPDGWYLPNDQEWTDLANGIVFKSSENIFNTALSGSATKVTYDIDSYTSGGTGGYLGQAMKSTTANGRSRTSNANGLDIYITNSAVDGGAYTGDNAAFFWSSSLVYTTTSTISGYYRYLKYNSNYYFRSWHNAENCFSVRCKKITK